MKNLSITFWFALVAQLLFVCATCLLKLGFDKQIVEAILSIATMIGGMVLILAGIDKKDLK